MNEQYIILQSREDEQNIGNFSNKINPPLDFGMQQTVVGLTQIFLPLSWDNLNHTNNAFCFFPGGGIDSKVPIKDRYQLFFLPPGQYKDIQYVLDMMLQCLPETERQYLDLKYNRLNGRVKLHLKDGARLSFDTEGLFGVPSALNQVLGFGKRHSYYSGEVTADFDANLNVIHNLYIYADFIKFTHLGDVTAPILGIISVPEGSNFIHARFDNPTFFPVSKSYLQHMSIRICSADGEIVHFNSGRAFLKLVFKNAE